MRLPVLLLFVALGVLGCDPGMQMRGTVRSLPSWNGQAYVEGEPVADAVVGVYCHGQEEPKLSAVSQADGSFEVIQVGIMPNDCEVRVEHADRRAPRLQVGDLCAVYSHNFGGCHAFTYHAELPPAGETR